MENYERYEQIARALTVQHSSSPFLSLTDAETMTKGQNAILACLYFAPVHKLSPGELAESLGVGLPRIANAAKTMEEKGLLSRKNGKQDRRTVTLTLTPLGLETAKANHARLVGIIEEFCARFGEEEADRLFAELQRAGKILAQLKEENANEHH